MRAVLVACLALASCTANNGFYNCGGLGVKCCPDNSCKSGGSCNNGTCVQCGAPGQACCGGGQICQQCGGAGQPCCPGETCNASGLACGGGVCVACGAVGERCCPGAACNGGCCDPGKISCIGNGSMCSTGGSCANGICPP